jgi:transposase
MKQPIHKRDGRTLDHKTSEEFRRLAVRRVRDGEQPGKVMASLGLGRTSIYPWRRAHQKGGAAALKSRQAPGRVPALTGKQTQQVKKMIVGKDPRQYGFDLGLWTRQIVADLIEQKFGKKLGRTAIGRMLARLEITPHRSPCGAPTSETRRR